MTDGGGLLTAVHETFNPVCVSDEDMKFLLLRQS